MKATQKPHRLLSMLLCLVLLLGLLPVTAFAEGGDVAIDATNFEDEAFRAYVEENFDADKNGSLSTAELAAATIINVTAKGILSLKGVEFFTELTHLYCNSNQLATLDVSKNLKLTELNCMHNRLTSLDLSSNTALTTLYCDSNRYPISVSSTSCSFDLSTLPGSFDLNRVRFLSGMMNVDTSTNTLSLLSGTADVCYEYDMGNGHKQNFWLDVTWIDDLSPALTLVSSERTADTAATVQFYSSEAGSYYYAVVDADAEAPVIDTTGAGTPCDTFVQTIALTGLTAGKKDVYIVVKDAAGNVSKPLVASVNAYDPTIPVIDAMKALKTTTTLPAGFDYELGSEDLLYSYYDDRYDVNWTFYAKLLKIEFETFSFLDVSFAGKDDSVDTTIFLFREDGSDLTLLSIQDSDNLNGYGEKHNKIPLTAGTYYLALASYSDADTGVCRAELSAESYDDSNAVTGCLCFLQETVPVPEEGALWSWNEETKTLTLRDGFTLLGGPDDDAICLPDDATVLVEGRAAILFSSDDGIYCDGSITIRGSGANKSLLAVSAPGEGIYADEGDVLIEDCSLAIDAGSDGVLAYGNITVRRSDLDITSGDEGLDVGTDEREVRIENSRLRIVSGEEGIEVADDGNAFLTDSDVYIDTTEEEEGIYVMSDGNITVSGGRLVIAAYKNALEGNEVTLNDVVFDLRTTDDSYDLLDMDSPEGFSLPGIFRLYDFEGNELYMGEWKDDLLNGDTLYVENTQVFRAVSVHEHSWSDEWAGNETHHWHECEGYCDITENEGKAGYAAHEPEIVNAVKETQTKDGYTGDTVCKICGRLLAKGKAIPAGSPQTGSPQTGDKGGLFLWIALLLVSFSAIAGTAVYSKKRKSNSK